MNNTITLTLDAEQLEALKSGKSITIEPHKPVITKWEPKGGTYYPNESFTEIHSGCLVADRKLSGLGYSTKSKAEQAAKAIRSYARQLSWIHENNDGWVADWNDISQYKSRISYDNTRAAYRVEQNNEYNSLNTIYMSKSNAEKLCKLLNNGIVEF